MKTGDVDTIYIQDVQSSGHTPKTVIESSPFEFNCRRKWSDDTKTNAARRLLPGTIHLTTHHPHGDTLHTANYRIRAIVVGWSMDDQCRGQVM